MSKKIYFIYVLLRSLNPLLNSNFAINLLSPKKISFCLLYHKEKNKNKRFFEIYLKNDIFYLYTQNY